ncbi:protein GAMETE EXPRESSED 2 [Nymphaea colorata]|nr:protein GAMETE EXPRESSED 2 [Nymphaea colorata]
MNIRWLNGSSTFKAGEIAIIKVNMIDHAGHDVNPFPSENAIPFTLFVNGTKGNSSYVSGVSSSFDVNSISWSISFTPLVVGLFSANVSADHVGLFNSSLHFSVTAGPIYPSACMVKWKDLENEFVAGSKAKISIRPSDAFGNDIPLMNILGQPQNYMLSVFSRDGHVVDVLNVTSLVEEETSQVVVEFIISTAGTLFLHVEVENQSLRGSPLPFLVNPGPLDITKCFAKWNHETNFLQVFSLLEIFIYQQDVYGNLVSGWHSFDADIMMKSTNLSVPITDTNFEEVRPGIQSLTFTVTEPGEFILTIFDSVTLQNIFNMPYNYTVYIGYCHGSNSVVNGSGLAVSVAGRVSYFSIYLEDAYHNPSPIELTRLRVQILRRSDSYSVLPNISGLLLPNSCLPDSTGGSIHCVKWVDINNFALSSTMNDTLDRGKVESSTFNVSYATEKSGIYEVWVFCGNIPLNSGKSFTLDVSPGKVDVNTSSIQKINRAVRSQVDNAVLIQLTDSFMNPVYSQKSKLRFVVDPKLSSSFTSGLFEDYENGSYVGYYVANQTGNYEVCILYQDQKLDPCPFEVQAYDSDHFPEAKNLSLSIWEDESVAFDIQTAVRFSSANISILGTPKPHYGTLLQHGTLLRYTPYKGFFGNDTFSFTISDANDNVATGFIMISVLNSPPQFSSLPVQLQAVEDVVCPRFGGYSGFEIKYSNIMENISVTLSTQSGSILFSSSSLQSWQTDFHSYQVEISTLRRERLIEEVLLVGPLEVINSALQSIQYLGNKNFFGTDVMTISLKNRYGVQYAQVPILVEPVNDPPYVTAPKYFILKGEEFTNGMQIYDKEVDNFDFSIGDPDSIYFPDINQFILALSMEVSSGVLIARLHVSVIDTVELKLKGSNHWQPLDFFVIIKDHVVIEGKGIRFRGKIEECNNALQHVLYQGRATGAVLTITVNDMGNYGCYPEDCSWMKTAPLLTRINIDIIKRGPLRPLLARSLGAAIVLGFVTTLLLGTMLLFFSCKCALALKKKGKQISSADDIGVVKTENFGDSETSSPSSESMTYFTGCSSPFLLGRYDSRFRRRYRRGLRSEESNKDENLSDPYCPSEKASHSRNYSLPTDLIRSFQPYQEERDGRGSLRLD